MEMLQRRMVSRADGKPRCREKNLQTVETARLGDHNGKKMGGIRRNVEAEFWQSEVRTPPHSVPFRGE